MKVLSFISTALLVGFLSGCSDPNKPVQTAKDLPDSVSLTETPGATPQKADSVLASPNGPDQMVPENSTATQTISNSK